MRGLFIFSLLLPILLWSSPVDVARRVQAHLLIGDTKAALKEGRAAVAEYPEEPLVYAWAIRSLAAAGEDSEMMALWEKMHLSYEKEALDQDLLEEMCWGILKKGRSAPGLSSQMISLIGAALGQDIRALPFLLMGLRHTNVHLREVAAELSAHYGDQPLREEIARMVREETVLDVRVEVIRAVGQLHMEELLPQLIHSVANPKTGPREKLAAIEAIIQMMDKIGADELNHLATSSRAGLRQLACEVIAHCDAKEEITLLRPLLTDPHPDVSAAAIHTWGLLREPVNEEIQQLATRAVDPNVGITASWCWLIDKPQEAESAMEKWLTHSQAKVRALAAGAVAAAGPYGVPLAMRFLKESQDSYVRLNLAIGLAGQRLSIPDVCTVLDDALKNHKERWMLSENGIFHTLEKSSISHSPKGPNYPEVVNQSVRLELLNLLAILEYPSALETIKQFLKERKWGLTGLAAESLLGEGDETAIDLVRELLKDPDREIRIEAALVLASWAKDNSALPILMEAYPKSDRQLQLKILESLGRIGDKVSLPFLIERLKEPSLMIRMVAACVLIQTLNH